MLDPWSEMDVMGIGWPPWSMLYITAFSLPSSFDILMRVRRPFPAWRVPCQFPVMSLSCACSAAVNVPNIRVSPTIHKSILFMCDLLVEPTDCVVKRCGAILSDWIHNSDYG